MNTTTESYPIGMRNFHAFSHFHHRFLLIFLFVFFILSSRSAMAAEPPNSVHPPSRTVSSSPALRTSRARGARRPQSDTGWYYADDSRHWYYQLPAQNSPPLTPAARSASLLAATAQHSDLAVTSIANAPFASLSSAAASTDASLTPPSPLLKTGWHHDVDGFTYYFDPSDGHMLAGVHTIDGIEYSFLPDRDRGNYHQDSLGTWFYRANGLAPYGSLLFSRSSSDRHSAPAATRPANADRDHGLIDSEDLVTDRLTIPPKASPSELTRDNEIASPSELPREEDSTTTPSEIPREDDPPATPSDDRNHAHTSDPSVHCIATDDWSTILANRDAYGDCIEHHCTALLYLSGPPVSQPPSSPKTTTQDYPLYVSLVDAHDDQLIFAQAYAIPELNSVPMYVGTSLHDSESTPIYKQSNLGGVCDTWLFRTLVGTGTTSAFRFYLKDDNGTYSQHEFNYPGYQIRIPDMEENRGAALLPLQKTVKYISRGYHAENAPVEKLNYTKYLARKSWKENKLAQLYREAESKSSLWFPSAQELREYTLTKTEENTYLPLDDDGDPLLSMYLKPEHYIPALADCWRSDESYWLRSTPSAYLSEDTYVEQGMTKASTRDEYFLQADSTGSIRAAHYDDTAAVRLIFTVE